MFQNNLSFPRLPDRRSHYWAQALIRLVWDWAEEYACVGKQSGWLCKQTERTQIFKKGLLSKLGAQAGGPGCSLRLYDGTRKQTAGCWEEASTYTMVPSLYLHTSVLTLAILRA